MVQVGHYNGSQLPGMDQGAPEGRVAGHRCSGTPVAGRSIGTVIFCPPSADLLSQFTICLAYKGVPKRKKNYKSAGATSSKINQIQTFLNNFMNTQGLLEAFVHPQFQEGHHVLLCDPISHPPNCLCLLTGDHQSLRWDKDFTNWRGTGDTGLAVRQRAQVQAATHRPTLGFKGHSTSNP